MTTRRQFIEGAFTELGLGSFAFDMGPQQFQDGMIRLDAMMADWNAQGVRLGYPIPASPGAGDLNDETNVPDMAWQAITTNLALRVAPMFGKTPMQETKAAARLSWNTLLNQSVQPMQVQLRTLPAGAGNKPWRFGQPFTNPPVEPVLAGPDGPLE